MVDIIENYVAECMLKAQTMRKMFYGCMDKITKKRERKYYLLMKCSAVYQHKKTLVRDVYAAEVCYYLDCWLGVTKIRPAGPKQL